jgi:hypothetical protein
LDNTDNTADGQFNVISGKINYAKGKGNAI